MLRFIFILFVFLCGLLPISLHAQFDDEDDSPLVTAVKANNLKEVKRLVEAGEPIETESHFDDDALSIAISSDYRDIALYLLSKGAKSRPNFYSAVAHGDLNWIKTLVGYEFYDSEAMIPAIETGNIEIVKYLISKGFPVDFEQKRRAGLFRKYYVSPLELAFEKRSDVMVLELVKAGAPLTEAFYDVALFEYNDLGKKLIDLGKQVNELFLISARTGNILLLDYCLSKGADKNTKDSEGKNALLLAAYNGRADMYHHCLNPLGLSPNSVSAENENALMLACRSDNLGLITELLEKNQNLEFQNTKGETVLFYAERCEKKEVFELVLAKGPVIDHKDNDGNTVLLKAAQGERTAHVNTLIEKGADVTVKTKDGKNLISCLLNNYSANETLILSLIEKGVDPKVKSPDGNDFAFIAIERGDTNLLKLLMSKGISVDGRNSYGQRSGTKNVEIIKFVIEHGGDPNARDSWSNTYLCSALEMNDLELAAFLVKHKADVNIPSCFMDEMLLFEAIKKDNLNFVQFLVESKADLYIKTRWSKNVMEVALEENNPEIIAYLKSKGAMTKEELNKREVERAIEMQNFGRMVSEKKVVAIIALLKKYPEIVLGTEEQKSLAYLCAEQGSIDLLQICFDKIHWKINDELNFEQQTMLHIAAKQENKDFVVFLVKKGADVHLEDAFGKKPIEYAKNKEIKQYLKTID